MLSDATLLLKNKAVLYLHPIMRYSQGLEYDRKNNNANNAIRSSQLP